MENKNLIISANAKLASKRKAFEEAEMKNKRAKDEILAAECELEVMKSLGMDSSIPGQESCQRMTGPLTDFVHKIVKS